MKLPDNFEKINTMELLEIILKNNWMTEQSDLKSDKYRKFERKFHQKLDSVRPSGHTSFIPIL